jgi:ketosteroid isomerase-like protein
LIEALYHAYVTGDLASFDACTNDSVWDELGRNERAGVYRGKQAILDHAMQLAVLTDGTIATRVNAILPGDNHVAVLEHAAATRNGRVLDMDCCSLYTLREDKIAHVRVWPFDASRESGRLANRGLRSIRRVAVAHTAPAHGDDYVPIH